MNKQTILAALVVLCGLATVYHGIQIRDEITASAGLLIVVLLLPNFSRKIKEADDDN